MPSPPLLDLKTEIRKTNPQRFEMEQLSGIIRYHQEENYVVAFRDVKADEWWCRGHIPGRPLFPGVLMMEAAAQMASWVICQRIKSDKFLGFGGVEGVRFRGTVEPPCRIILVGRGEKIDPRRSVIAVQSFVNDRMVFEGKIIGMFI
jgi:3-hydroxyacyl-[acyl-carrier-protein] dehydratase